MSVGETLGIAKKKQSKRSIAPRESRKVRLGQGLSPRERQVVAMIAEGMTGKEIAFALGVCLTYVRVISSHAQTKTGARNLVQLARIHWEESRHAGEMATRGESMRGVFE